MHCIKTFRFGPVEAFELGFAPVGRPLITVFVYRVGHLLIDSGQRHLARIVSGIAGQQPLDAILLTHHHEDHSGNAGTLSRRYGIPVYAHPQARRKLKNSFHILPYQHYMSGKAARADITPYPEMIEAAGAGLRFRPIHTPGHSKDHTAFLEQENGWLFSGDLYLGDKIHFFRVDEHLGLQITSLKKILKHDFDALFCGHRPQPRKGRQHLVNKLDFLLAFHERVSGMVRQGLGEKEIVRRMQLKSDLMVKLITLGNVGFVHMVRSSMREARAGIAGAGARKGAVPTDL